MVYEQLEEWIGRNRHCLEADEIQRFEAILQEYQEDTQIMHSSTKLLLYQVEDILGLAQIQTGKFSKILNEFNIMEAVREIISVQQFKANSKRVSLRSSFCGFEGSNYNVKTDVKRFQQVLLNLQSNALKYT